MVSALTPGARRSTEKLVANKAADARRFPDATRRARPNRWIEPRHGQVKRGSDSWQQSRKLEPMGICGDRLSGITRTMPRGTFEQTEFPNRLDCVNCRCRNPPLG